MRNPGVQRKRVVIGAIPAMILVVCVASCTGVQEDPGGMTAVALLEPGVHAYSDPVWSPDGKMIGFNQVSLTDPGDLDSGDFGPSGFWLMNADGSAKRRELPFPLHNPDWSPDGRWLVFEDREGLSRIAVVRGHLKPETREALPAPRGSSDPTFGPGGNEILYAASGGVFRLSLATGRTTPIGTPGLRAPDWSPDGNRIAHEIVAPLHAGRSTRGIGVMDADGSPVRILTAAAGENPKWSPDGRTVALTARPGGERSDPDLFLMGSDGTGSRRLTFTGVDGSFDWSPDGRRIVYTKSSPGNLPEETLWIVDVETGEERPVAGVDL